MAAVKDSMAAAKLDDEKCEFPAAFNESEVSVILVGENLLAYINAEASFF